MSSWRLFVPFCALILAGASRLAAQTTSSTPPPTVLQSTARLVSVDVLVLDRMHQPVQNLKASDFEVRENGKLQAVNSFDLHGGRNAEVEPAQSSESENNSRGIFSNALPSTPQAPVNIWLIDSLNTQTADQAYLRSELQEFLKKDSSGARIAIFTLQNNKLRSLQSFSSDPKVLLQALLSSDAVATSALLTDPTGMGGDSPTSRQSSGGREVQVRLRNRYTMDALKELAAAVSSLPGRKSLYWFAGSFPLSIERNAALSGLVRDDEGGEERLRETLGALTQARVAVYPVDCRGQAAPFGSDAVNSESKYIKRPDLLAADLNTSGEDENHDHLVMEQVAQQTGGQAIFNQNAIGTAIAGTMAAASRYYTLSYTPVNSLAGEYRRIDVKIPDGKYELAYRHTYLNEGTLAAAGKEHSRSEKNMSDALRQGFPDAVEIQFKAKVSPAPKGSTTTPAGQQKEAVKAKGPWCSYRIDLAADPRPIRWTRTAEGFAQSQLELIAIVYDHEGRVVNSIRDATSHTFTRPQMLEAAKTGVGLSSIIDVPEKGTYSLRIAIHDVGSGRVGTVEVPVILLRDLPQQP